MEVSTLSRPKAAGQQAVKFQDRSGFNTQPPEGGCDLEAPDINPAHVSTLSRPKAAVFDSDAAKRKMQVSTLSRPKAAG